MIKILFICHGNICRSPMAEFVMKDLTRKAGLAGRFEIASAATTREEIGNPVYPPVKRLLDIHKIDCTGKAARQLTRGDYEKYDYLIGMDEENLRHMKQICGEDHGGKFHLLMEFAGEAREVADPWYTRDFAATWNDVQRGCRGLLEFLMQRGEKSER